MVSNRDPFFSRIEITRGSLSAESLVGRVVTTTEFISLLYSVHHKNTENVKKAFYEKMRNVKR